MFRHLLIPTDGSEAAQKAVRAGIDLAEALKAAVTLVTVSKPWRIASLDPLVASATDEQSYLKDSTRLARERLKAGEDYALAKRVKVRSVHVYEEHVWKAIIEEARANVCDLIFMASHGRKGTLALVLGSETAKVLVHSTLPVLVYR
jgi:nucleotide-binding universal stress UspA family protein